MSAGGGCVGECPRDHHHLEGCVELEAIARVEAQDSMAGRVGVQTAVSMDEIRSRMIRMIRIRLCGDWEQDVGNRLERGSEGAEARQKDDAWPRAEREVLVFFGCSCVSAWAQGQCGRWADGIVCLRDRAFREMSLGMGVGLSRLGIGRLWPARIHRPSRRHSDP